MESSRIDQLKDALSALNDLGVNPDSAAAAPALEFLLRKGEDPARPPERKDTGAPSRDLDEGPDAVTRAVEWTGVAAEAIQDIVEFGEQGVKPTIYHGRLPREKAQRQRAISLIKLGFDRVAFGKAEVPARQVNDICGDYECLDQNLPTNLQRSGLATRRGTRGSYYYRLTLQGEDRARELIRSLAGVDAGEG